MKIGYIVLSVLLMVALVLGALGCAKPAPAPAQVPVPAKPIELTFSIATGGASWFVQNCTVPYLKELETKSGGRLKTTLYSDASLLSREDTYDGVAKGIADMGMITPTSTPERFPMSPVVELPFAYKTAAAGTRVISDLYEPYLKKEYPDMKFLVKFAAGMYVLYTTKKPVKTMADLKGLRLRFMGTTQKRIIELLGAVPTYIASAELYTSLERGLVDGVVFSSLAGDNNKLYEICKYITEAPVGGSLLMGYGMNPKTFDSLPKDLQKVVTDVSDEWSIKIGELYDQQDKQFYYEKWPKQYGVTVLPVAADEVGRMKSAILPIYDEFVAGLAAKGLPGKELMSEFNKATAKYTAK